LVKGFTLVELLIAMALSVVGLLGLLALQSAAIRGNGLSRNFQEATALAQDKLEEKMTVPFANLLSGTVVESSPELYHTSYTRTTATTINGATASIQVTVSWTEEQSALARAHSVVMSEVRTQ
jgi:prepilin-type N-terminal cleavage/methylation domain-containing protein